MSSEELEEKLQWEQPPQESPHVGMGMVLALAAGALLVFGFATLSIWVFTERWQSARNPRGASTPARLGQAEINLLNQLPFLLDTRAYRQQEEKVRRLHGYGWVDRERGLIHIPVEQAMELYLEREAAGEGR
jgi:hypothetical protein